MSSARICIAFPIVLLGLISNGSSHPAFQHRFNNIVNANPCLKVCMDQATQSNQELSLLKTANVSGFLLNVEDICRIISTARDCIDGCNVDSNPFSLESMTTICSPQTLADIGKVSECLRQKGDAVLEKCAEECGDYDDIDDEIHRRTQEFRPNADNNPEVVEKVMEKINDGCRTLKCSNRCAAREFTRQCAELAEDVDAGEVIRSIIESVLAARRRDLERTGLVDTLAQTTPPHCTYMYAPEAMFDSAKDKIAHSLVSSGMRPTGGSVKKAELSLALSQLQAHLLKKQIRLQALQERNLQRESQKLDMEMELLARKRAQFADGVPKVYPSF